MIGRCIPYWNSLFLGDEFVSFRRSMIIRDTFDGPVATTFGTLLDQLTVRWLENPPFWWYLPWKMGIFMGELLVYQRVIVVLVTLVYWRWWVCDPTISGVEVFQLGLVCRFMLMDVKGCHPFYTTPMDYDCDGQFRTCSQTHNWWRIQICINGWMKWKLIYKYINIAKQGFMSMFLGSPSTQ